MQSADRKAHAIVFIRVVLSILMFIHGAARISNGTVGGFGEFLELQGFPLGFYLAWAITLFELVGSVLLAVGLYSWIIAIVFAMHLTVGIVLVHWKDGWFVVGAGRNGIEYSVLLVLSFLAVAYASYQTVRR
ncbi:MAG: DoxX family protein [Blastocatellia bacterium]|jgi:putative oxidoreductase|nr:DoxX family protein [Blastocatellia bacterium]